MCKMATSEMTFILLITWLIFIFMTNVDYSHSQHILNVEYSISTVAGGRGEFLPANSVGIGVPLGVSLSHTSGELFFVESWDNTTSLVRFVDSNNNLRTCAGGGKSQIELVSSTATLLRLQNLIGAVFNLNNELFVSDTIGNVNQITFDSNEKVYKMVLYYPTPVLEHNGGMAFHPQTSVLHISTNSSILALTFIAGAQVVVGGGILYQNDVIGSNTSVSVSSIGFHPISGDLYWTDLTQGTIRYLSSSLVREYIGSLTSPMGMAFAPNGDLYVSEYLTNKIKKINYSNQTIVTIANLDGIPSFLDGSAPTSRFNGPTNMALNSNGTVLYVVDSFNHRIRRIDLISNMVSTVAGDGTAVNSDADGVLASKAILSNPQYTFYNSKTDALLISDTQSNKIKQINSISNVTIATISTIFGNGTDLNADPEGKTPLSISISNPVSVVQSELTGDIYVGTKGLVYLIENSTKQVKYFVGGASTLYDGENSSALSAQIKIPYAIAVSESDQSIYFFDHYKIRKINSNGTLNSIVGSGELGFLDGLASISKIGTVFTMYLKNNGDILMADYSNSRIRLYSKVTGNISTIAGTGNSTFSGDGGSATLANFKPGAVIFVPLTNEIIFSDSANLRIRKIDSNGIISTIVGNGGFSPYLNNVFPFDCPIGPSGLAIHPITGELHFLDFQFHVVRKIDSATNTVVTVAGNGTRAIHTVVTSGTVATSVGLDTPGYILFTPNGDLYFSLIGTSQIIKMPNGSNILQVAVGTGMTNYNGDYLDGSKTNIGPPYQLAYLNGSIIFGDTTNGRVRKYSISSGKVVTIAGGFGDYAVATNAMIETPYSMSIASDRNELFIMDSTQNRIRKVSLSSKIISTAVGNSYTSESGENFTYEANVTPMNSPKGIIYSNGQVTFCDTNNFLIKLYNMSTESVTAIVGNGYASSYLQDNAKASNVSIFNPQSVAYLPGGEMIIAETSGNIIRKINSDGIINRIAGLQDLSSGFTGDSSNATTVALNSPMGLSILKDGRIIFADSASDRLRMLTPYCKTGYQLTSLESGRQVCQLTCFNVAFNSPNVCSGKGKCNSVNNCACNQGYVGSDCSLSRAILLGVPNFILLDPDSTIVTKELVISKLQLSNQSIIDEFLGGCTNCVFKMDYTITSPMFSLNASDIVISLFNSERGIISLSTAIKINQINLDLIPTTNFQADFSIFITRSVGKQLYSVFSIPFVMPIVPPSNLFNAKIGSGNAIKDNFTISINEWNGSSAMLPLKYAVGILPTQTNYAIRLTDFSEKVQNVSFVLPYLKGYANVNVLVIYAMDSGGNIKYQTSTNPIIVNPFSGSQKEFVDLALSSGLGYNLLTTLVYDRSFENITDPQYYSSLLSNIVINIQDISAPLTLINYLYTKSLEQPVIDVTLLKLSEIVQKLSDNYNNSKNDVGFVTSKISSSNMKTMLDVTSTIWSKGISINDTRTVINNIASLVLSGEIPSLLTNSSGVLSSILYTSPNINLTISSFKMNAAQASMTEQNLTHEAFNVQFNPAYIISKYSAVSLDCGVSLITYAYNNYGTEHSSIDSSVVGRNSTSSITDFKFFKNQKVVNLENLEIPILLTFSIINSINIEQTYTLLRDGFNSTIYNFTCAYLDESSAKWNNQGCSLKSFNLQKGFVECSCNHTTLFTTFLEQKTLSLSGNTKLQVASLYYGQISLGVFYLIISTTVLILIIIFRKQRLLSSRLCTPYLGMIALMTESLLIYIVQRSVLVDQLFKDSTNWSSGDLASNWIANIVMIFVNTLNLTAILSYLIQVCRYQMMKYLYTILQEVRKSQYGDSRDRVLKLVRRFTSNIFANSLLISFIIVNVFYWTLWVILRRCQVIQAATYTYIVSVSYIVIIFSLSALITCVSVVDFVVSMIQQRSIRKKSKELSNEPSNKTKIDLEDVKEKISSMGIHKWIISMDSPLYFRCEMLLYIAFFILLIVNQSLGLSTLPLRYETEESFRNALTNDVIAFIFEVLYVAIYILVFGGYPLLIIISNKIKFKLRRLPDGVNNQQDDDVENKELIQVIDNPYGTSLFEEFCKKEFSTENLYLYLDLQENQHLISNNIDSNNKELSDLIARIYNNHIKFGSMLEVNLPSACSKQFSKLYSTTSSCANHQQSSSEMEMADLKNNNSSILINKEQVGECFKNLRDNVILNLSDTFSRFVLSDEYGFFSQAFDFKNNLAKSLNI